MKDAEDAEEFLQAANCRDYAVVESSFCSNMSIEAKVNL